MKIGLRGATVSLLTMALAGLVGCSQPSAPHAGATETETAAPAGVSAEDRQRIGYAMGVDVANSFAPLAEYIDLAALRASVDNAFAGGKPELDEQAASQTDMALRVAMVRKSGQPVPELPPGVDVGEPDPVKVAQMLGGYAVGPSLQPYQDQLSLDAFFEAMGEVFTTGKARVSHEEAVQQLQAFAESRAQAQGEENRRAGTAFLEANKRRPGVMTTESGLQYQIIRPGSGARPGDQDRVRVNYHGKLLDGTVFDSSYERGEPAEFSLEQVIPGWREGVALMPVGAKYRFWIPSDLAYGANGAPGGKIGPDATLTFDVELLGILP